MRVNMMSCTKQARLLHRKKIGSGICTSALHVQQSQDALKVKHLEFDVLIAHALLDGAAIYSQARM